MKLDMQWTIGFLLLKNWTEFLKKNPPKPKQTNKNQNQTKNPKPKPNKEPKPNNNPPQAPIDFFSEKLVVFKSIAEENKPLIFFFQ